jgi:hypothetical protein
MKLDHLRSEIAFMRMQVGRQRSELLQLQRAGIPTASAETLLQRMLDKIDGQIDAIDPTQTSLRSRRGERLSLLDNVSSNHFRAVRTSFGVVNSTGRNLVALT